MAANAVALTSPLRRFEWSESVCRFAIKGEDSSEGMVPLIEFLARSMAFSAVSSPSWVGRVPLI